jgi:beta-glucanase (GH16 family)
MGTASASAATKFVVTSPTTKAAIPGKVTVSAKLTAKRSAQIVSAKFYVNGKKITTDNRYPFKVKRGVKFDTRNLPTSKPTVRLSVVFKVRKSYGKLKKRTLKRSVRIKFFLNSNPSVGAQGTPSAPVLPSGPCSVQTPAPAAAAHGYPLAFNDDFDNCALSSTRWSALRTDKLNGQSGSPNGTPFSNLEGAGYATSNVEVKDGELRLTTSNTPAGGRPTSTGSVNTYGKFAFKHGYIETRARVPRCDGCWPVLFLLPTANHWPPEIDVFEFVQAPGFAQYPTRPFGSPHWATDGVRDYPDTPEWSDYSIDGTQEYLNRYFGDVPTDDLGYTEQWHTYGMLWTADKLQFYFDGVPGPIVSEIDGKRLPKTPVYPIISLQTGNESLFPFTVPPGKTMQVDYMRVYSNP